MEIEDTPTATTELICNAIANCDELTLNKVLAMQLFTLWMHSPLLGTYIPSIYHLTLKHILKRIDSVRNFFLVSVSFSLSLSLRITIETDPQAVRDQEGLEKSHRPIQSRFLQQTTARRTDYHVPEERLLSTTIRREN